MIIRVVCQGIQIRGQPRVVGRTFRNKNLFQLKFSLRVKPRDVNEKLFNEQNVTVATHVHYKSWYISLPSRLKNKNVK